MKKYWKSMSMAVITVITIGSFYIHSELAGSDYPEFEIETISGNEEDVEDLILYGDYREGDIKGANFQITGEGIQYHRDLSYFNRLREHRSLEMKQLQEDYKGFMRGKHSILQLAENEENLVYADVISGPNSDMEFQIEVLDKNSNETMEFTVDVPDEENYGYIYIEQVHIAGEKAKVVTRNPANGPMDSFSTEIHVYDFDIGTQTLANDEIIISYSEGNADETMTNVYTPGDGSTLRSNSYAIFILEEWEHKEDGEGFHYSHFTDSKVISIDVETNEHSEFELSEELQGSGNTVLLEDSKLYFTKPVENGLEVTVYDLGKKELDEDRSITIERNSINTNTGPPLATIKDGKMYIVSYTDEDYLQANILAIDVIAGELVYEGQLAGLNGDGESIEQSFHLFDISIR